MSSRRRSKLARLRRGTQSLPTATLVTHAAAAPASAESTSPPGGENALCIDPFFSSDNKITSLPTENTIFPFKKVS